MQGIVRIKDGTIFVEPSERFAIRLVCAAFDTHLGKSRARHASQFKRQRIITNFKIDEA